MNTLNTVEVLTEAKAIIADPSNWIQGEYYNEDRTCFCALGAIAEVSLNADGHILFSNASGTPAGLLLREVVSRELKEGGYSENTTFAVFNDNRTHAEVMEAFDKAIEKAKQQSE